MNISVPIKVKLNKNNNGYVKHQESLKYIHYICLIFGINNFHCNSIFLSCVVNFYCISISILIPVIFIVYKAILLKALWTIFVINEYIINIWVTMLKNKNNNIKFFKELESTDCNLNFTKDDYKKFTKSINILCLTVIFIRILYSISFCAYVVDTCTNFIVPFSASIMHVALDLAQVERFFYYYILSYRMKLLRKCVQKKYDNCCAIVNISDKFKFERYNKKCLKVDIETYVKLLDSLELVRTETKSLVYILLSCFIERASRGVPFA